MRFILLAICFLFVACGTTDLSGTYICNDVIFSSQTMTPTEIAENQKAAKEDLVDSSVTVVQYDETIWIGFSDTDGDHFRKASNNEYVFISITILPQSISTNRNKVMVAAAFLYFLFVYFVV